jgi:hypothetical protein
MLDGIVLPDAVSLILAQRGPQGSAWAATVNLEAGSS